MKPLLLLAALPALLSLTAHAAPQLRCHTRYNGESQTHLIAPVASPYGVEMDRFNRVTFAPVKATALRLEVRLQPNWSGGILEWKVE